MARPLEPTPTVEGEDAERFLKEMHRIDNLDPNSQEAKDRHAFFEECRRTAKKFTPIEPEDLEWFRNAPTLQEHKKKHEQEVRRAIVEAPDTMLTRQKLYK